MSAAWRATWPNADASQSVREQYEKTAHPSAETYIWPTERFADVVVSGRQPIETSTAAILAALRARGAAA